MNDLGLGIIVSLKDAFTQNASRIQSSMQTLDASVEAASENMTRNIGLIEKGTMMIGAGLALLAVPTGLVTSTVATQKALGELASVGVKDFRAMEDAAESFTNKWAGTCEAEFITAGYDVKSALANLSDQAVGTFAGMAALTAKATKATVQEMVETFTTGYGIFKPLAKDMSDIDWAKMFSGALAETVGVFKTTGPQMAEAIKNVGAIAAASNVPLEEQMAILGQLQTTMPGSEAGTLYKAFMLQVAKAGGELGLSFVNAQGRLKGIVPILKELKRGFPDLSNAAAQVKLKKAFGSDEAVRFLLQMSMGLDQLENNIKTVSEAMKSGTAVTLEMAKAMNMDIGSQYELAKQQVANLAEILGRTMLPVVTPVFQAFSRFVLYLQSVAKNMPGITRAALTMCAALGAALVIVGAIVSAIGTIGIVLPAVKVGIAAIGPMLAGVGSAVSAYFWPVVGIIAAVIIAVIALKRAWETNFAGIRDVVLGVWNKITLAFQGIRALIGSLSGGTGQMSAELAKKLQAAGLMGFVTTVFQIYFRIREFLTGIWETFSSVFSKVRAILEPAMRSLIGAFGALGKAIGSIFSALGLVATALDASSFKSFGQFIGALLGAMAQVAASIIDCIVYPLSWVIRILTMEVKAIVWFAKTVITALIKAAPYIYRFCLPVRMLAQGFLTVGRIVCTLWQLITGNASAKDALKSIGSAIHQYLSEPFLWAKDVASGASAFIIWCFGQIGQYVSQVWSRVRNSASAAFSSVISIASNAVSWLKLPFSAMANGASYALSTVRNVVSNAFSYVLSSASNLVSAAFQSGRSVMTTIAAGIRSAVMAPYEAARSALSKLRRLLPFSDAKEGPLSALTQSGAAMLEAFSAGITRASQLPAKALESSLVAAGNFMNIRLPASALAATLALTPVIAGAVPNVANPEPVGNNVVDRSRLLAVSHGTAASEYNASVQQRRPEDMAAILEAILVKIDGLSERPIDVSVTTKLDGRQIARSVYKDMREQKIKNYETA